MNTIALVFMIVSQVFITVVTIYFFVLAMRKKGGQSSYSD